MLTVEEKNYLKKMLGKLPEDPNRIPISLFKHSPEDIAELIDSLIKYYEPAPPPNDGREFTRELLGGLDKFKDELGGAPNFQGGIVTLNNDDADKTFMGQPLPAVKDWFRKTLDEGWKPKSFWTLVAKHFSVTKKGQTQYEKTHGIVPMKQRNAKKNQKKLDRVSRNFSLILFRFTSHDFSKPDLSNRALTALK
tara:strand:+ start:1494 stop:2075 length:582 start_codon:yes stop_codon:yes gene_type:complete